MLRVDPKQVEPGDTFLDLSGDEETVEYAIDKGAACIITEKGEYSVKTITTTDSKTYLSNYLRELNLEKLEKLKLIGIVGTSGKTITGDLIFQLLNNLNSKTAYIGTNGFYLEDEVTDLSSASPDLYQTYEFLNQAVDAECKNVIIEVSSKAIADRSVDGLRFDTLIFTNYNDEDVEDDKKQEYLNTKIELFKMLKKEGYALINKKDPYHEYFVLPQNHNIFYGTSDSEYKISNIALTYDFTEFNINDTNIKLPILGSYNIYNYLAAYLTAKVLEFTEAEIVSATANIKATQGRFQNIKYKDSLIIIDNAYNKITIENVVKHTKEFSKGKIYAIIGCEGDYDQIERPIVGKTITDNTDYVIFTTDNPRHEDPSFIIDEIILGVVKDNYEIIENRKDAIKKGIELLNDGDILLILGKGHEEYQIIGSDHFPFSDYNEVLKHTKK